MYEARTAGEYVKSVVIAEKKGPNRGNKAKYVTVNMKCWDFQLLKTDAIMKYLSVCFKDFT